MLTSILRLIIPAIATVVVGQNNGVIDAVPTDAIPLTGDWLVDLLAVGAVGVQELYLHIKKKRIKSK